MAINNNEKWILMDGGGDSCTFLPSFSWVICNSESPPSTKNNQKEYPDVRLEV